MMPPTSIDLSKLRVRKTEWQEVSQVGELLVDGFHDSPFWSCIDLHTKYPDAEKFFFERRGQLMFDHSFLITYEDQVIGHYCISPENDTGPAFWKLMWYGLYLLPIRYGWQFTKQTLDLLDSNSDTRDEVLGKRPPAVKLEAFVIKQEWRGRGIGKFLLEHFTLKDCSRMVLMAQEKDVVGLYEKVGFRTLDQRIVRTGYGREYENWIMEYDAAGESA
ncbi:hypothetical protein Poli38472_008211 [Pythium oligandrum]|uniref:N-acetyltransferase domain-containing protein n=1 Tax=Pythium oligandrum TaxID=41045 RepID=A0A8K1CM31_PYTOL|nr:hypothetical protein Poli38472_008211 [Pythium oligandrum]|eukprot:TMW65569.1 hypothetical protein Poli38472_008211 [Pythium oligandrum]